MIPTKILSTDFSVRRFLFRKKTLRYSVFVLLLASAMLWYIFSLPSPLFDDSFCTVITDRKGDLLGAKISDDGQFRFPERKNVPYKLKQCIIQFEDKRFYKHSGTDPIAVGRAILQNIRSGEVVSGASTLSMQVIRLARKNRDRTVWEKFTEMFRASRLEQSYTKDEILSLYFSHAPFGGNVVGVDAAAWRWFGIPPEKLTWAQSATLAVLPNAPSLIHPGRNRDKLLKKRNRLLKILYSEEIIDSAEYRLSLTEPVPDAPKAFPFDAYHLLNRAATEKEEDAVIQTTIDGDIQRMVNQIVFQSHRRLEHLGVMNLAAIVLDTETGEVLAYVGNVPFRGIPEDKYELHVDMIQALRSTGSVLKPFLYASMLTSGDILENAFVPDIPTKMGGFTPENFNRTYDGVVPAGKALARSLNIPASRMLRQYGLERFYYQLEKTGLTSLDKHPGYYGLSLVLGGCEAKLWELVGMYASMGRSLLHYSEYGNRYDSRDYHPPWIYFSDSLKYLSKPDTANFSPYSVYDASALWTTFKVMLDVDRPETELNADDYTGARKIAWKTGTSFGFRDAWAIGLTPRFTVGVWAGNADGEGRAGLIGVRAAAPVLFRIFDVLPSETTWFPYPDEDFIEISVCKESGFLAGPNCPNPMNSYAGKQAERFAVCPYHKIVHLDPTGQYRVHADCFPVYEMISEKRLILPPAMEKYYKAKHPSYQGLPSFHPKCADTESESDNIELIYPHNYGSMYIPTEIDGTPGKAVFEAVHRKPETELFWYIDDRFIASTRYYHLVEVRPDKGKHILTIVDEYGETIHREFEVLSNKD